ncbi:hypothetical protein J6590_061858 [Homalodisca vitripennis]|nr:hypothetical protein J6590_061858 [Homalodisca vitripennis]
MSITGRRMEVLRVHARASGLRPVIDPGAGRPRPVEIDESKCVCVCVRAVLAAAAVKVEVQFLLGVAPPHRDLEVTSSRPPNPSRSNCCVQELLNLGRPVLTVGKSPKIVKEQVQMSSAPFWTVWSLRHSSLTPRISKLL